MSLNKYTLGASFCRQTYKHGGVCIYILNNIPFNTINLEVYPKEKDLHIYALKLSVSNNSFAVIFIYRSPTGDFIYSLNQLESILNKIYNSSIDTIICADFNINYLQDNSRKQLLDSLLASFNLFSTVKFPTRNFNNSSTLIDNIYVDTYKYDFSVYPFINGLSDHDAQIITFPYILTSTPRQVLSPVRKVDSKTITNFMFLFSHENWEDVF